MTPKELIEVYWQEIFIIGSTIFAIAVRNPLYIIIPLCVVAFYGWYKRRFKKDEELL